jgi:hypothetical protein
MKLLRENLALSRIQQHKWTSKKLERGQSKQQETITQKSTSQG